MKRSWRCVLLACLLSATSLASASAQSSITGRVTSGDKAVPFASIQLKRGGLGAAADMEGYFRIDDVPPGTHAVVASAVGFRREERLVVLSDGSMLDVNFDLEEVILTGGDIVVTATRTERDRREVPVIVSVLDHRIFESTQAVSLSEGLNFVPGLRLEIDCQTCNYSQVRLNGLEGSYSQILIDSRPIFSALNGLYGLEQIPTTMIERVEVIRGGGSALFGASAVAGTINIITREPVDNAASASFQQGMIGGGTPDRALSVNTSIVNDDRSAGAFLFGVFRDRQPYDHDGDEFSEIPYLRNNSFGLRGFYRPSDAGKLTVEAHSLTEERQGGNHIGRAPHLADQGEYRLHHVLGGGLTYEQYLPRRTSRFAAYVSGQYTGRDHYTGINHVDAYGETENVTLVGGLQVSHTLAEILGTPGNVLTAGVEAVYDDIRDEIPFYDRFLEQTTRQAGVYLQSDWTLTPRLSVLFGGRFDAHNLLDAPVVNPRLNVLLGITSDWRWRGTYSTGFRAPQAFDADLHIAFADGGVSHVEIDPNLVAETSRSFSTSLDFDRNYGEWMIGFTVEGFHTRLFNTFILEELGEDAQGNLLLERRNGSASNVSGLTGELRFVWADHVEVQAGLTAQRSLYDEPVAWSSDVPGTRRYLRTPNVFGFYTLTASPWRALDVSISGVLTGPMDVQHFAGFIDADVVERSQTFLETNLRIAYGLRRAGMIDVQLFGGLQNVTNAYQSDFDQGRYRDSGYVYGPARPRTVFMGVKLGL